MLVRHLGVGRDGIACIAGDDRRRRCGGVIPPDAVTTVNVMVAGEPAARLRGVCLLRRERRTRARARRRGECERQQNEWAHETCYGVA